MTRYPTRPYHEYVPIPEAEMLARAQAFNETMQRRRTIRQFSDRPVDRRIIEQAILAAGSAPSGAHMQPWHFVVIERPETKRRIREEAEKVEADFYANRISDEWREVLAPLGTDDHKPYLETAPFLVVVFEVKHSHRDGRQFKHYYVPESVGIATGFLISALHHAGLATLTHTPSPMGFLSEICRRPASERPFLLLVTGYPAADAAVPDIARKSFGEIATLR